MRRSEIFTEIENAMTNLNIVEKRFKEKLVGMEVSPYLSKFHGQKWDLTADQLLAGEITDEEFLNARMAMIKEYKSNLLASRIETVLVDGFARQIGPSSV